jgi:hypothetical protein
VVSIGDDTYIGLLWNNETQEWTEYSLWHSTSQIGGHRFRIRSPDEKVRHEVSGMDYGTVLNRCLVLWEEKQKNV